MKKIYGPNNPNYNIFQIPTEEGPDSDDNMCAMIGDAAMAHLQSLSPSERQCWEHYVLTGGKNLFTFTPNPKDNDKDPWELKVEDLDTYFDNHPTADGMKPVLEEAIQNERERRANSEDAYDRASELIPYQDWVENPGQFKHFDMPTTPKALAIYCGNTDQVFYDVFPEGHPDAETIRKFLMIVNKDPDALTVTFGAWVKEWVSKQTVTVPYTERILNLLVDKLVEGEKDPEEVTEKALTLIDQNWQEEYLNQANDSLAEDAVHNLLATKAKEWDRMNREGINVLPFVKSFGQTLYTKFRKMVKRSHWAYYKRLKGAYRPALLVRGLDINNCRVQDLERVLKLSRGIAVAIWTERPFNSVRELVRREVEEKAVLMKDSDGKEWTIKPARKVIKGWLNPDLITEQGNIEELYDLIKERAQEAKDGRNLKVLSSLSQELVNRQKDGHDNFTSHQWNALWGFYRHEKSDIMASMKGSNK